MEVWQSVTVTLAALLAAALAGLALLARALWRARAELAVSRAREEAQSELARVQERELASQREALRGEFATLAARLLNENEARLAGANARSVQALFADLKEKLEKYEREVATVSKSNLRMGSEMKAHVESLATFAREAQAFTAALVGGTKIQGNQGEGILARLLEQSGLVRGVHYEAQTGRPEEGRPDVCLFEAQNRYQILIDSKMNLKDYVTASSLPDDSAHHELRARALRSHAQSIRRQIDSLSERDYAGRVTPKEGYENLPLVVMFCPFEAVLEAALAVDPTLMQYAYEKGIVLVTPLTLWGYLWLIVRGWKRREVERRYDEIQALGRDVVSALDSLLGDLAEMGESLAKAHQAYERLSRRATDAKGRMSVRRVALKLLDYGVTPKGRLRQLRDDGQASGEDGGEATQAKEGKGDAQT